MIAKHETIDSNVVPEDNSRLVHLELERIQELSQYEVMDTDPEPDFDDLASFACEIFQAPISLISLMDESRVYFKSMTGLNVREAPKAYSFCEACIESQEVYVVEDAREDSFFCNHPSVIGPPFLRFYAGAPLFTKTGYAIGSICIIDSEPRQFDLSKRNQLKKLARQVMRVLELRRAMIQQRAIERALKSSEVTLRSFFETSPLMMGIVELHGNEFVHVAENPATVKFTGHSLLTDQGNFDISTLVPESTKELYLKHYRESALTGIPSHFDYEQHFNGKTTWWSATVACMGDSPLGNKQYSYVVQDITDRVETSRELQEKVRSLDIANLKLERERSHLSQANKTLTELSQTDSLTGLLNRRVFYDLLLEDWNSAKDLARPLSLIIIDIDQFKSFNDTYGHLAGDHVLQCIGQILLNVTRGQDFCARLGGEEFAILMPGTSIELATQIAERLRQSIENENWELRQITASFGISGYHEEMETERELLRSADRALYHSKRNGRNRVSLYGADGELSNA